MNAVSAGDTDSPGQVHDDIGRGNFLAIYMASGVFSSFTSLTAHVLAGKLRYTSLGASGAVCGLVATWLMIRSKYVLRHLPLFP